MLRDLQKIIELQPSNSALDALKGLSFSQFWDAIGWPEKNGIKHPIYPYENQVIEALDLHKYLYVLKGTGLGITELILRWVAWQALKDDSLQGHHGFIVCGPREQLAITLIERIKGLFPNETFTTDKTTVILNGFTIQAMPSHALASMRGQLPKIIIMDEASFFPPSQAAEARSVSERYISKSDPWIVLISTPFQPGDLMHQILEESPSMYEKILLPYTVGLGGILTAQEVEKARKSPSFEREMNLSFTHGNGNLCHPEDLSACTVPYDLNSYPYAQIKLAIDPAWGVSETSSRYGIAAAGIVDGKVRVFYANSFKALSFDQAEDIVKGLIDKFGPQKIIIDGANPAVVKSCKALVHESTRYEEQPAESQKWWRVVPFNFNTEGRPALGNLQELISKHILEIHPDMVELIGELRNAQIDDSGKLDKTYSSFDILDALRMAVKGFKLG